MICRKKLNSPFLKSSWWKKASTARNWINSFPPNRCDDLCLFFCLYPSSMVGWYSFCIIWTEATKVEDFFGPIRELASKIEQISQVLLVGTFASVQSEKRLTSLVLCYWWKAWISTDPIGEGFCWCPMRKQVGQHRQSNEKTDWPAPSVQWESRWPAPSVQWAIRIGAPHL